MSFQDMSFADNPDPRCPVVLALDTSASMGECYPGDQAPPISELNEGLEHLVLELHKDPLALRRVEIAIVTFGSSVEVAADFATADHIVLPTLEPSGTTAMGGAIDKALDLIDARKTIYKNNGIPYYRPWLMMITDGLPTDDWGPAAERVRKAELDKRVAFFPVGVHEADFTVLDKLGTRKALKLRGLRFTELFVWLSASQSRVSASNPGEAVALPTTSGWAEV